MRFSEAFGIAPGPNDDWCDPHLTVDTKLFVDPLLLLRAGDDWANAHAELITHFIGCYRYVSKATSPQSVSARIARRMLTFPEPSEFGLGYTSVGTRGSGSGDRFAAQMADGIAVAIAAGLDVPEHIEEIGILNLGVGPDRISDAVCNVLKSRFIAYTQEVANRNKIKMEQHKLRHSEVSIELGRWTDGVVQLPTNPATKSSRRSRALLARDDSGTPMNFRDVTDRSAVLRAIKGFDETGRD